MALTETTRTPQPDLKYRQVMAVMERNILTGKYLPGQKLPSIRDFSQEFGFDFRTVRKAMHELAKKGLLNLQVGSGTFVQERSADLQRKTIKIGLACGKHMLDVSKNHPSIGASLAGMMRVCSPPEYVVVPLFYRANNFTEDLRETLLSQDIGGVVITGGGVKGEDCEFLHAHRILAVNCSPTCFDKDGWTFNVYIDNTGILRQAIEHLCNLGHRQISFISYQAIDDNGELHRCFGQLSFEHQLGDVRERLVLVRNEGLIDWENIERFFDTKSLPTALVVMDEFMADVVLTICERRGIKVPDDLSIVCLHDLLPYGHRIPLTASDGTYEVSRMTHVATDILIRLINGKQLSRRVIKLNPKIISKASTCPVRA